MKNIVFVDDERELLDGLRARLYKQRKDWRMQFVLSGAEALAIFEKEPVDLIVSDVRMPGMDGGQLLTVVKQRWPNTMRIIVSGYSDPNSAVRLTSLAHQFLAKPCEERVIENVIDRCFHLTDLLNDESLRNLVGRIGKLPAIPKTFARLQSTLAQPDVTAAAVADIINTDAAIATKVLQITNSAFFRLRKPMVRIKDAVTYLGFATLRNLVLCAELSTQWRLPRGLSEVDPQRLQRHAEVAAAACKALAGGRTSPDDAWLAGLLHDIGYWILVQECPQQLAQAIALSKASSRPLFECELEVMGAAHSQIGAYLLGLWGLPYPIVEAVALHHTPTMVDSHTYDLLATLAVAHALLEPEIGEGISVGGAGTAVAALAGTGASTDGINAEYLSRLGAPFDWDEAQRRVRASTAPSGESTAS